MQNKLITNTSIRDRILLEDVPSAREYLDTVLDAIKQNRMLSFYYEDYWEDPVNVTIQPYFVKLFRQHWKVIGPLESGNSRSIRSYALDADRMKNLKIMEKRLSAIEHRSAYLSGLVNQPEASPAEYARANKELRNLRGSIDLINELRTKQKEIEGLKSLVAECQEDKEMLNMATEELCQAMEEERGLQNQLLKLLLPKDDADERDCILEVRAGTGGEEASLFAMDIFKMYERYSLKKSWKFEVVEIAESDLKGYKVCIVCFIEQSK